MFDGILSDISRYSGPEHEAILRKLSPLQEDVIAHAMLSMGMHTIDDVLRGVVKDCHMQHRKPALSVGTVVKHTPADGSPTLTLTRIE